MDSSCFRIAKFLASGFVRQSELRLWSRISRYHFKTIGEMISLVLFTTRAPSRLADELAQAGFSVFEVLAISEVLHLCETEKIEIVLIAADVEESRVTEIQHHVTTYGLSLSPQHKTSLRSLGSYF